MIPLLLGLLALGGARGSPSPSTSDTSRADTTPSASSALGALYRQARSDQYYTSRYAGDGLSVSSGTIGTRSPDSNEPRDAAYFESRCITCDPNKPSASGASDRGYRQKPRYDWYDYDLEDRRSPVSYRDRYDDYDRGRSPGYDYDQRYNRFGRYDLRPIYHGDRYENRYDRDRVYDRDPGYDRNYDRGYYERGNGYDNLDSRYPYESREDVRYYSPSRRPSYYEDPYVPRYDRRNRYGNRYEQSYDRYDPYDRIYSRKPAVDDRYIYDRFGSRGGSAGGIGYGGGAAGGGGGYFASGSSGSWGPGYDRGYASAWNYAGSRDRDRDRDNWRDRDFNRDRDPGYYRPRDYFYDSTAAPGASRGTSYLHDRPESSTPSNSIGQESATNSPKSQDTNKVYKD
ncbi:eukaryotic translation initiation factor 3 subunit A isoform X1 [Neodiprion pinetum]|uniref:eukaryotic translation initiation factor 3 subunit A isoform X1 n=1 Tax=Neodiprion pinetum TaxID=441929 RepID=UPI001EE0A354|nr:splicing factor, arginine/serine-rich 19 isoform X1 [Neodiprion pinetum]